MLCYVMLCYMILYYIEILISKKSNIDRTCSMIKAFEDSAFLLRMPFSGGHILFFSLAPKQLHSSG